MAGVFSFMIEAFPLQWPEGFERSKNKKYSQFQCTVAQARDGVLEEIKRLKGQNPIISSNVPVKRDGQMYGNAKPVDGDTGVAVYFTWDNEQYVLACDQYMYLQDNLRAIEKSIDALRGLKRWGASDILKRAFKGFKALPPSLEFVVTEDNYKSLVKKYHPDNLETGDHETFIKIQQAYENLRSRTSRSL